MSCGSGGSIAGKAAAGLSQGACSLAWRAGVSMSTSLALHGPAGSLKIGHCAGSSAGDGSRRLTLGHWVEMCGTGRLWSWELLGAGCPSSPIGGTGKRTRARHMAWRAVGQVHHVFRLGKRQELGLRDSYWVTVSSGFILRVTRHGP